jgi:serine/threonine protein kinase/formylglycine-generating enzyme required for sulfatase activity
MNPRQPPGLEDHLAAWLAQYHEALKSGVNLNVPPEFASDPGTVAGLQKAMASILLLERVWPWDNASTVAAAEVPATPPGSALEGIPTHPHSPPTRTDSDPAEVSAAGRLQVPGFEVLEQVGRGGMGLIYRARQIRLDREVALKVLPPGFAEEPERLQRFHIEAAAAARLNDARVLPVLDLLDVYGTPVLVLPYVRGGDLGRILRDRVSHRQGQPVSPAHAWSSLSDRDYLEKMLDLLDPLLDAVAAVHRAGVVHRDIKPSNVLVDTDGKLWLSDFGLARLGQQAQLTTPGLGLGSPGYMGPEQWDGAEDIDARADVFGLGVTLYQALTLDLPFGRGRVRNNQSLPAAPRTRQPLLTADLDAVVLKALEPDRAHRYPSAVELRDDWRRARQGQLPQARRVGPVQRLARRVRRHPLGVLAVLLIATLLVLLMGAAGQYLADRKPMPPELPLATPATREVEVVSEPAGARVVLVPLNENGEFRPAQAIRPGKEHPTPLRLRVPPGDYLVVAALADGRFHEVYRRVPPPEQQQTLHALDRWTLLPDGAVRLESVVILDRGVEQDMTRFQGGEFWMGPYCELYKTNSPRHRRQVAPFYLDTTEVTVGAYRKSGGTVPSQMRERHPGPPADFDDYPISCVSFYRALHYAEQAGKRLPTEAEYEFAATGGGEFDYPWGNEPRINAWPLGPVKEPAFDKTDTNPPVYGLYSNVGEWIDSLPTPYNPQRQPSVFPQLHEILPDYLNLRIIRGAPPWALREELPTDAERKLGPSPWLNARWRQHTIRDATTFTTVGFRCARSVTPRFLDDGPTP